MSEIKDGGPAFGQVVELRCVRVEMNGDTEWEPEAMVHGGLTVRDYVATKVAPAFLAELFAAWRNGEVSCEPGWMQGVAQDAYFFADEMIKARDLT
ncbi:hypothetical protein NX868_10405 [Burkholderia thailandensis]|uniref:hypothetical protein n=1 Tax=Burkholderia thailandensis TaxID=57975 RepID=UPI001376A5C8|nr:hypothetical protein [Burkholderia thailandensis]MCS6455973.1 hypothetical protein [Burkholderia thailandensis]MCS6482688.1 hypothetical protein [Burkholderia thailandensis]NBD02148.1 hypothetical protein [Burkholderia thailandensis]